MKFDDAQSVEGVTYQLVLGDWPRALNRVRINDLFNGLPPFSESEAIANNIEVNINDLKATTAAHDARAQGYGGLLKGGNFFTAKIDRGPKHKRQTRNGIVTQAINRKLRESMPYFEYQRAKIANWVLHGIAPGNWVDPDYWTPDALDVGDALLPSGTRLTMKNLPLFAVRRSYTAPELIKLTRGPRVDPAWNMDLVNRCLEWVDKETNTLMGSNWPEVWAPEKIAERLKGDGVFYATDSAPTIDTFDFYFWDDSGDVEGWRRRVILDAWSQPQQTGKGSYSMGEKADYVKDFKGHFLYNSGDRVYADKLSNSMCWQFADLSAVGPFRYHSIRSLGFLLWALCHFENRLRCKFNEAVLENLLMYFRVKSSDDVQRALKLVLSGRGFVDDTVQFLPPAERWNPNEGLIQLGLNETSGLIDRHSRAWTQDPAVNQPRERETNFQFMSRIGAMNQLAAAALTQAYRYQKAEYIEIVRRFMRKNSRDVEVREARASMLRQGIPEEHLVAEAWEISPVQALGQGNKTMEMAIAEQLFKLRNILDPSSQRKVDRDVLMAITDDPARVEDLVPDEPLKVTDSVHDAQLAAGTLMQGLPVALKAGMNHIEYVETMLVSLQLLIAKAQQSGGMASAEKIEGMQRIAEHITQHIQIIAQDPEEKDRVKRYQDQLGKLMNIVRAFAQRLQEQMAKQQQGNGGLDAETQAKLKGKMMLDQAKAANMRESHAQRTAQRQVQFEQQMRQDQEKHLAEIGEKELTAAQDLRHQQLSNLTSMEE